MYSSVNYPSKRNKFFEDINKLLERDFFEKYFPNNLKAKTEKSIRVILVKTGLYKRIKVLAKKILGK